MMHPDVHAARAAMGSSHRWLLLPIIPHPLLGSVLGPNLTLRTALKNVNGVRAILPEGNLKFP